MFAFLIKKKQYVVINDYYYITVEMYLFPNFLFHASLYYQR